ncbi:hypothetical protein REB14_10470 [Chryseobacterium sp. ES2]|uniref:Uncharacterized protein n=1 Tax=Chryseobacterium metallicongregator TaxID=3073042 RepID=A0ABU1E466_9FLAO|nr:hypothetical protein [Chryseobacterium sp. ES2]MDR4952599.1 hypothetical protein [Chryseobacterium sp. ES2]
MKDFNNNKIKNNNKNMNTVDNKKLKQELILAEIAYQLEFEKKQKSEAKDLYFEMDCEEQIWVYKDSKIVADIYNDGEWENKINVTININPYSNVTFKKIEKKLRDFLFNEWTREQYEKLEISESCLSKDLEHWKDQQ